MIGITSNYVSGCQWINSSQAFIPNLWKILMVNSEANSAFYCFDLLHDNVNSLCPEKNLGFSLFPLLFGRVWNPG